MHEKRFALDIGTRSVVGIILEIEQESYNLLIFYLKSIWTMIKSSATCLEPSRND